jgi:hypothetical protein
VYTSPSNPFAPTGFNGSCQFPQITRGGLEDSVQHGVDLKSVYSDLLDFIPSQPSPKVSFRVTNNVITSQVSSSLLAGYYPQSRHQEFPVLIQPSSVDSLEPAYNCPAGSALYKNYSSGGSDPKWTLHLIDAKQLYAKLDSISGVSPTDSGFHMSFDHYFDNLSSRQCHAKPMPCSANDSSICITQDLADTVYRLGQYEYSYTYRSSSESLPAAVATYGVWIAELAQNIRDSVNGKGATIYRHNIAHDGSVSRLLAILQVDTMFWPGMGSEVVFEIYRIKASTNYAVRVLLGGQVLKSSHPSLGFMSMVDLDTLLAYFDGLVGVGASKVPGFCSS